MEQKTVKAFVRFLSLAILALKWGYRRTQRGR